ncbi:hypothetical protein H5410_065003 [Solanum commersonii]|uniref:Uncharacterized protein n=1 Tax=Solanum commersonii TaxID=4109 RepID=A0A9J5VXT5_SOLCO|nr:hypothetical protein H5410_065003 [Solanum commersonii]
MLVEPKQLKNMCVLVNSICKLLQIIIGSIEIIEIVEKCCGPQTRSPCIWLWWWSKGRKDMRGDTLLKMNYLSTIRSTQEENKSLNEKNKSLNDRLSTLEDEMKEIRKMQEFFLINNRITRV